MIPPASRTSALVRAAFALGLFKHLLEKFLEIRCEELTEDRRIFADLVCERGDAPVELIRGGDLDVVAPHHLLDDLPQDVDLDHEVVDHFPAAVVLFYEPRPEDLVDLPDTTILHGDQRTDRIDGNYVPRFVPEGDI